ncbi:MAG: NAD-dependent epimerase/dehydratase family protein, partial [Candidatus Bathyarchaeia archaeon]
MTERTLVTGASGWLGNRLCQTLGERGRDIRAMVIPQHIEHPDILSLRENLPDTSSLEVTVGDVRDPESLDEACRDIDTVFHTVGVIHPGNAKAFYEINTEGDRAAFVERPGRAFAERHIARDGRDHRPRTVERLVVDP